VWRKRRFLCQPCGRTFTEQHPELYRARHRLLKASERLSGRERRRLCELFEHAPLIAEAWGLNSRAARAKVELARLLRL
jgi:transposase-like protein